jgi:hypothetical protein
MPLASAWCRHGEVTGDGRLRDSDEVWPVGVNARIRLNEQVSGTGLSVVRPTGLSNFLRLGADAGLAGTVAQAGIDPAPLPQERHAN